MKNGVKKIQVTAYNGARTVYGLVIEKSNFRFWIIS
jgi:hypothetical protein